MYMKLLFLLSIYSIIRMGHSACVEGALNHIHARIQKVLSWQLNLSEGVQI